MQFIPESVDKFRLSQASRCFAQAGSHCDSWKHLSLQSVGHSRSRVGGRKIMPSTDFFIECLQELLSQNRFRKLQSIDARDCFVGHPSFFIGAILARNCAYIKSIDLTRCLPDMSWSFLRSRGIPSTEANLFRMIPRLETVVYDRFVWSFTSI